MSHSSLSSTKSPVLAADSAWQIAFLTETPHGILAGVHLPERVLDAREPTLLTAEENAHASSLAPHHRVAWMGGRCALRIAAQHAGVQLETILATRRGAPALPPGIIGSISHKRRIAIALVDRVVDTSCVRTIGVDIEDIDPPRPKIARLVLSRTEADRINTLPDDQRWLVIATVFSIKESVFKAIDPHVQRHVGFHEARVDVMDHPRANVELHLKGKEGPFDIDARWDVWDRYVITSVRCCG